jgi:hypothetical protein
MRARVALIKHDIFKKEEDILPAYYIACTHTMVHRHIDTSTHRPSRATRCQHANAGLVQHDPVYIELGISTSLWNRHKVQINEKILSLVKGAVGQPGLLPAAYCSLQSIATVYVFLNRTFLSPTTVLLKTTISAVRYCSNLPTDKFAPRSNAQVHPPVLPNKILPPFRPTWHQKKRSLVDENQKRKWI